MSEEIEGQISLEGYKAKVQTVNKATLVLDKDLIFVGRTARGYEIEFDPKVEWGCMPTESLLLSVAGCLAIDVVSFLRKMRCEVDEFKVDIEGFRNPVPPQYYTHIVMTLHLKGEGITAKKVEKVILLSQEKYCSVYHSLRKDLKVDVKYNITERAKPEEKNVEED